MFLFYGTDVQFVAFLILVLATQLYWELRVKGARP